MRRLLVLACALALTVMSIGGSNAAVPLWNVSGTYTITFSCTSGCGGDYLHTMEVTLVDNTTDPGTFSGSGSYQPDPSYTWDVSGTVSGSDIAFHILYTGTNAGYTVDAVGAFDSLGVMSGTASSSAGQTFDWAATAGRAAPIPTNGSWSLYPEQTTSYATRVLPPINPDGTSNWPAKRGVIPVQFSLWTEPGPVVLPSIGSDDISENDWSYLAFIPDGTLTFSQVKSLVTDYSFTTGDCVGGSMRWQIGTAVGNLFIYYGAQPNFTSCTGADDQSGVNMIGLPDRRYDTSQVGGTFYDTYEHALELIGAEPITYAALMVDGGWSRDQVVVPSDTSVNDNRFVPTGEPTRTCDLPEAAIAWERIDPIASGQLNEVAESVQLKDSGEFFRIVDCKYIYNLSIATLGGTAAERVGTYKVYAVIGGQALEMPARFDLK